MTYESALTDAEIKHLEGSNCAPRFESIIGQTYIAEIWVWDKGRSEESEVVSKFYVKVYKQFVGTMHKGTKWETVYEDTNPGWIEDGCIAKGEMIYDSIHDTFEPAYDDLSKKTLELIAEIYSAPDNDINLA